MNGPTIGHAWELNRGHKSVQGSISLKPCSAKTFLISPTSNHHRLSFPSCWRCLGGSWKLSPTVTPFPIPGLSIPSPVKTIDDEAGNPSANDDDVDGILIFPSLLSILWKKITPMKWDLKSLCHSSPLLHFDNDEDYADLCLGRQSQGGGGAALMSSCPQPKPTLPCTLCVLLWLWYTQPYQNTCLALTQPELKIY